MRDIRESDTFKKAFLVLAVDHPRLYACLKLHLDGALAREAAEQLGIRLPVYYHRVKRAKLLLKSTIELFVEEDEPISDLFPRRH